MKYMIFWISIIFIHVVHGQTIKEIALFPQDSLKVSFYNYTWDENGNYVEQQKNKSVTKQNDNPLKDQDSIFSIVWIDAQNFLFFSQRNGQKIVNVNHQEFIYDYEKIFYPVLDTNGNFAFYGQRDYFLYKFVNGKEVSAPISKYGVRATPIQISPKGESIHLFETNDKTYLYKDKKLLLPPFSSYVLWQQTSLLKFYSVEKSNDVSQKYYTEYSRHSRVLPRKEEYNDDVMHLQIDTVSYFLFNGTLSKPVIGVNNRINSALKLGGLIPYHFFVVLKTGEEHFELNIDNQFYQKLEGVSEVSKSYFFTKEELVFYGIKNKQVYQFKVKL